MFSFQSLQRLGSLITVNSSGSEEPAGLIAKCSSHGQQFAYHLINRNATTNLHQKNHQVSTAPTMKFNLFNPVAVSGSAAIASPSVGDNNIPASGDNDVNVENVICRNRKGETGT